MFALALTILLAMNDPVLILVVLLMAVAALIVSWVSLWRYRKTCAELANELGQAKIEKARVEERLETEREVAGEKMKLLQDAEKRMKLEFENLANRIFEDKGRVITEQNREKMTSVLEPFKTQLESFRKRVDEIHEGETKRAGELLQHVRQLQEMSNKVSAEANHLATAIKGDTKRQGAWGELIVSRIFEVSGLAEGREYEAQRSFSDEEGRKRPDFIVHLPGDKSVIVDAKVSLTAYERFSRAENDEGRKTALADHVKSVRGHIKELQGKNYDALLGNRTLDFVIMCVPVEPAYQAALEADPDLLYDLARTQVVLTGPATLMITLKLIAQIWRRENENNNAEKIASIAGRMYDQIIGVYDALADVQKKLVNVDASLETAMNRLKDGRGSLVGKAEDLRVLGAKVSKKLPMELTEQVALPESKAD